MIKAVDKNWLMRRAKAIETRNLRQYGTSTTWITILNRLNACVVCTYDMFLREVRVAPNDSLENQYKGRKEHERTIL